MLWNEFRKLSVFRAFWVSELQIMEIDPRALILRDNRSQTGAILIPFLIQ